ncbi:hypothetical protein CY0110_16632 [Crocosphaera chwakensis CCY0110]|uniref:Uncharacterized protein n=1 Tax=Crocosphaera chwakensis CCY0110 TaxID=391612 RepID=A3II08_9CHRO|nr:hypothetical protein CY0110_16632 [Crocosphaera chwakensis CCY0110]
MVICRCISSLSSRQARTSSICEASSQLEAMSTFSKPILVLRV